MGEVSIGMFWVVDVVLFGVVWVFCWFVFAPGGVSMGLFGVVVLVGVCVVVLGLPLSADCVFPRRDVVGVVFGSFRGWDLLRSG